MRRVVGPGLLLACLTGLVACSSTTGETGVDTAVMERIGDAPTTIGSVAAPAVNTTTPAPVSGQPTASTTDAPTAVVTSTSGLPTTSTGPSTTTATPTTGVPIVTPDRPFMVARPTGSDLFTYRAPDDPVVRWRLPNPGPFEGDRVVLVLEEHAEWLLVDLPVRPNGSTGWVRRSDVTVSTHDALVRVDLSEQRLWAWEDGNLVAEGAVALGAGATPTPTGRFYVNEIQQQADPDTIYGAWIIGTSGFSEVLDEAFGGDPAVAIHGTNDPAVLGLEVSLGCVRVHDDVVARLAELPLGTPVEIID